MHFCRWPLVAWVLACLVGLYKQHNTFLDKVYMSNFKSKCCNAELEIVYGDGEGVVCRKCANVLSNRHTLEFLYSKGMLQEEVVAEFEIEVEPTFMDRLLIGLAIVGIGCMGAMVLVSTYKIVKMCE